MDITGVHDISVVWCRCADAESHAEQLLACGFFPATVSKPRTAFTFWTLKFFQMLNHVARTTPWDFTGTIRRLSDNIDPTAISVCDSFLIIWKRKRI